MSPLVAPKVLPEVLIDDESSAATSAVPVTDGELLLRFTKQGDQQAFARLVARHAALVWSSCRQVLACRQDVEDAYQATFLILAQRASDIRACDSAAGWLYRVAHRTSLALWRKRRGEPTEPLNGHDFAGDEVDPLEQLSRQHATAVLCEELQALPRQYREPLVLCHLEGHSQLSAAEALDVTTTTVKGRLARGRRMLRLRLAKRGIALSVAAGFAAAAVESAQAATAWPAVTSTAEAASGMMANPSGPAVSGSPTVSSLVQQGVTAMYYASLAKPILGLLAVAVVGVGVAIAAETRIESVSTPTGVALVATAEASAGEADGATITVTPAPDSRSVVSEPSAGERSVTVVVEAEAQPEQPTRRSVLTDDVDLEIDPQQVPAQVTRQVVVREQPLPDTNAVFTPTPVYTNIPGPFTEAASVAELELEKKYWETRAEGLKQKSKAMQVAFERVQEMHRNGQVSPLDLSEASVQLGEATLMQAEVYKAQAKVLEMERRIKARQTATQSNYSAPPLLPPNAPAVAPAQSRAPLPPTGGGMADNSNWALTNYPSQPGMPAGVYLSDVAPAATTGASRLPLAPAAVGSAPPTLVGPAANAAAQSSWSHSAPQDWAAGELAAIKQQLEALRQENKALKQQIESRR